MPNTSATAALRRQTPDPPAPPLSEATGLASIQPGGGFCIGLEAAWGRLRRGWLRRFRPGYVRSMAAKRQGQCEGCPHDIIDARDLKLVRNVCGYSFRAGDDPFRWRGELWLARAGMAEIVFSSLVCSALLAPLGAAAVLHGGWGLWAAIAGVLALWFQAVWFFRDPTRVIPADERALLSPADGVVTHIDEVEAPGFPGGRAFRISIYLSPYNVHLNRIPRNAKVESVRYFRGRFLNARHKDCVARNEQLWTDFIEPNGRRVRVKQISGALARRLVCWLKLGEEVRMGERFGLIKYGSRSDVLIPTGEALDLAVKVGDKVGAGKSVLLRFAGSGSKQ
ncbi:MAG: phosphatidylserine decarboxylase [Myxococcaceae bacterium]